jgi:glycerophosphoryl diester phosphodiesterase
MNHPKLMKTAVAATAAVTTLGLYALKGRTGHPGMEALRGWAYAHRGLHGAGIPENSMAAFRAALEAGLGIELDLHLMKDGNLGVIHDSNLMRVANADVRIEDLTVSDLPNYKLSETEETIPLFDDVLALFDGKAPLIVELKVVDGNYDALCRAAVGKLDRYPGLYCLESFDPRVIRWLKVNRPDLCRGQLAENWMGKKLPVPGILRFFMTYHISNVYTRPDFIAYKFQDRKVFGTDICRKIMGVAGVSWTIRTKDGSLSAHFEHSILITENEPEILTWQKTM